MQEHLNIFRMFALKASEKKTRRGGGEANKKFHLACRVCGAVGMKEKNNGLERLEVVPNVCLYNRLATVQFPMSGEPKVAEVMVRDPTEAILENICRPTGEGVVTWSLVHTSPVHMEILKALVGFAL